MKRGEIWTVAGGPDYAGKPRPAVIIQDDTFHTTASITICAFTTNQTVSPIFRVAVDPSEQNGLSAGSRLMVDKIMSVPKTKMGKQVGTLDQADLVRLNHAISVFLGLSTAPSLGATGS